MIPGSLLSCIRLSHSLGREKADLPTMVVNIILSIHFRAQHPSRMLGMSGESDRSPAGKRRENGGSENRAPQAEVGVLWGLS